MSQKANSSELAKFAKRALVVALIITLGLAAWRLVDLVILLFGSVLISIGLRRAALIIGKWARVGTVVGLAVAVFIVIAALAAALTFFGNVATGQFGELVRQVPQGLAIVLAWLKQQPYGPYVLTQVRGI